MAQLSLPVVAISKEIDGIEMGVLKDGTPYLSSRGLAALCGVSPSVVITHVAQWRNGERSSALAKYLVEKEVYDTSLYVEVKDQRLQPHPEHIVIAFLEYYAFKSRPPIEKAQHALGILLRAGFRLFVYQAVGYNQSLDSDWQKYHDRLILNPAPDGYFSVFHETSEYNLKAMRKGLVIDEHTVPDISVGMTWSRYWTQNNLDTKYGVRQKDNHIYPDYFPQSAANPVEIYVYPLDALPEFRRWLQRDYFPTKFPTYIQGKVGKGHLPLAKATQIIHALQPATAVPRLLGSTKAPLPLPRHGK